ncbi:hypothetical protein D9615_008565 [Tricholomella constricta]|uniref:Uncharacterized protein n=1 Tax=Tricholomella constricta TaxID=117010 RepID=A0A8H5H3Q7_9AGAR|nr:hypothetical protein D9615_008565 [Tricholomella constricta]
MPESSIVSKGLKFSVPDRFPEELQRFIFETAARADAWTARQLVLVARHVRNWIEPILYECILIRCQRDAALLFETIGSKNRGFFAAHVKYLGIGDTVTFQQAKAILAVCSHSIVDFAVWGNTRNPTIFFPFIRSHHIRRLSLKSQHPSELTFPPSLLSSLTHLMILDGPYSWFQMREAARHTKSCDTTDPEYCNAVALFRSLTHFGVCSQNWGSTQAILKVAENLKYFVVIVPPQFKATAIIAQRIEEIGDRRVVLVEHSHTVESWKASVRGETSVWERAERLVKEGYFAEHGDVRKWS